MDRLEKTTDLIVFDKLRFLSYVDGNFDSKIKDVKVWAKKSSNGEINKILSKASKKMTGGQGYPEYLIFDEKYQLLIVIENKKSTTKHIYDKDIDERVSEYAVNGALWYAKFLKEKFDTVAVGISGNSNIDLKIDTYVWRKEAETFSNLNLHELKSISDYRDIIFKSIENLKDKNSAVRLNEKAHEINDFLQNYLGVMEHERLYLLGSILFALEDPIFKMSYTQTNSDGDLAQFIFHTIERKIKGSSVGDKELILSELKHVIVKLGGSGKEKVKEKYPKGALLELVKRIDNILFDLHKKSELDVISTFFNVFLSYSTSGGSDLGIVLTPSHITSLFCDLAGLCNKSKVLDICAGTGGFLTSAWKRIALDPSLTHTQKEEFRTNNIFGIERESTIYTIVALNMFINKDGRSNLSHGDCFALEEDIRNFECNVGFLNPPFSDSIYAEIRFIELLLDNLLPNSIGVVIVPVNAVSSRTKKHSNLNLIKKRLLLKHKLIASIQMPVQLFYPKGTETVVLVFQTGISNEGETWFANFDDGYELIKHQNTRTPTAIAKEKYNDFLNAYHTKKQTEFSFNKVVDENDQWVYRLHYDVIYDLEQKDFQETLNEYISYLFLNGYF